MAIFNVKETEKEFKKFGDKVIHRARFYLDRRKKNTKSKTLSDSLSYKVKVYPSGALEMAFYSKGKAAEYFDYVEEGRRPGSMPPSSAIAKWISMKPIKIRDAKGRFAQKTAANVNSAAFAIAMGIKKMGIEPTWFFRDAFKMHYKRIAPTLQKAYASDSARFLKSTLGNVGNK